MSDLTKSAAAAIHDSFLFWFERFESVTRRAKERFERRDWDGMQADTRERLDLHDVRVIEAVAVLHGLLGPRFRNELLWREIKTEYTRAGEGSAEAELAETFFNSVAHRVFGTAGVNPSVEYLDSRDDAPAGRWSAGVVRVYDVSGGLDGVFRRVLEDYILRRRRRTSLPQQKLGLVWRSTLLQAQR